MKAHSEIPNWAHLRERYADFWQGTLTDDAIIAQIQNPAETPVASEPWMEHPDEHAYLSPSKLFRLLRWRRSQWDWHMDLFAYCVPSYGPNVFAGFLGGQPVFGPDGNQLVSGDVSRCISPGPPSIVHVRRTYSPGRNCSLPVLRHPM